MAKIGTEARRRNNQKALNLQHCITCRLFRAVEYQHFDVPEKLDAIQKAVESKPVPRPINYAEAAAKSKTKRLAQQKIVPKPRSGSSHILIISSKYENHTAEQVVNKLHGVVEARKLGVVVDRVRRAKNQKVVLICSSAEDNKKIEERIRVQGADLKVSKPGTAIRDVLKINSDEEMTRSLRTHISDYLDWDRRPVYFDYLRHPTHVPEIGYERVEDLESQTMDRLDLVGPHLYTDGSRIEGKVSAALTEWQDREENWYSTLRLDPFCTVFRAETVALQRAIRRVKKGKDGLVNIISHSRSSLAVLTSPKTYTLWLKKLGVTSSRSLRKTGLCTYFGLERMPESRVTSVQTNSPGAPPSLRQQRTTTGFRYRMLKG
ncbi:hypothetical protein EVAR_82641_1 [Eumeta japonica]|uniref:Uncharacterized protein n=1 Tax=Eumeta variegata TaxID=151549 RepID=A0A4C1VBR4_EUMVA|nr:hypothetical protein EVAR_82641_1 [Eumeta japonica]